MCVVCGVGGVVCGVGCGVNVEVIGRGREEGDGYSGFGLKTEFVSMLDIFHISTFQACVYIYNMCMYVCVCGISIHVCIYSMCVCVHMTCV